MSKNIEVEKIKTLVKGAGLNDFISDEVLEREIARGRVYPEYHWLVADDDERQLLMRVRKVCGGYFPITLNSTRKDKDGKETRVSMPLTRFEAMNLMLRIQRALEFTD